jgi:hypothetical protein
MADYLDNLACDKAEASESKEFIVRNLASRTLDKEEWRINRDEQDTISRRQLAQRLLRDDCAGKAGLDETLRAELRKLPEAPEPKPPATTAGGKAPASRSTRLSGTGRNDEKH